MVVSRPLTCFGQGIIRQMKNIMRVEQRWARGNGEERKKGEEYRGDMKRQ